MSNVRSRKYVISSPMQRRSRPLSECPRCFGECREALERYACGIRTGRSRERNAAGQKSMSFARSSEGAGEHQPWSSVRAARPASGRAAHRRLCSEEQSPLARRRRASSVRARGRSARAARPASGRAAHHWQLSRGPSRVRACSKARSSGTLSVMNERSRVSGLVLRLSSSQVMARPSGAAPNWSIERTFQKPLRAFWPAAHLQR